MEQISQTVDSLVALMGITGNAADWVGHAMLTLTAVLLAVLSGFLCRKLLVPLILKLTEKTEVKWDDILLNRDVLISACHIVPAVVIWKLMPLIYIEFPLLNVLLERATGIYIVVMSVKTAFTFIGSFKQLEEKGGRRSSAQQYFHSFCGVLRILMVFVAGVVVVAIVLGQNPMTLFAGLGATSAILMLVFKDTIVGLVAGVRLTSNDMLHKGDWITVKSADANGIVEDMSLTTVKVRNFDNTIVTISPTTLVNGSFQNWIGMQRSGGRRVQRKVYFDFRSIRLVSDEQKSSLLKKHLAEEGAFKKNCRPTNMTLFRQYVERWLRQHPEVNPKLTLMVRQLEATQCGLPIEFYFFLKTKAWVEYEHILAEIMEQVYALCPEFGLVIYEQYPEQA